MYDQHPTTEFKATFHFKHDGDFTLKTDHKPWEDLNGETIQWVRVAREASIDLTISAYDFEDAIKRFDQVVINLDALGYDNVQEKVWVNVEATDPAAS